MRQGDGIWCSIVEGVDRGCAVGVMVEVHPAPSTAYPMGLKR